MKRAISRPSDQDLRLLRHDWKLVVNGFRSAFSSWVDRLLALFVLLFAVLQLRASIADQPFVPAASAVAALAFLIGGGVTRLIRRRLDFHSHDCVLACVALSPGPRRAYGAAFHMLALGALGVILLIARFDLIPFGMTSYLAGAGAGATMGGLLKGRRFLHLPAVARTLRTSFQRPIAGATVALLMLLPLPFIGSVDPSRLPVVAGAVAGVAILALTSLDDEMIRFMVYSGYSTRATIGLRARGPLIFLAITVPACLVVSSRLLAGMIAFMGAAGLLLMTVRILLYRVHARRAADTILALCGAGLCIAGFSAPELAAVIAIPMLWHLYRRASAMTWMLT